MEIHGNHLAHIERNLFSQVHEPISRTKEIKLYQTHSQRRLRTRKGETGMLGKGCDVPSRKDQVQLNQSTRFYRS